MGRGPTSQRGDTVGLHQRVGDTRVDAHIPEVETLVDLGCGDGSWLDANPMARGIGIDLDEDGLRSPRDSRQWTFIAADLDRGIPLEDGSSDAVRANQVVEHIRNPIAFFTDVHRVLRSGGVFVATTPNIRYVKHVLKIAVFGQGPMTSQHAERLASDWDDGHIHFFTAHDLEWLAKATGFSRYYTEALVDRDGALSPLRRALDRRRRSRLVKGLLSGNLLLVARK